MKTRTKRRILYFSCFIGGAWLYYALMGSWWWVLLGTCSTYYAGCLIAEKLGWRRASRAANAVEHWSDAKKQEMASYGNDLNTVLVALFAKLAKLDGKISTNEISVVEEILRSLGIVGEDREAAIILFRRAKTGPLSFYDALLLAKQSSYEDPQVARLIMLFLIQLAHADGNISIHVREALIDASAAMGFCYEEIFEAYISTKYQRSSANSGTTTLIEDAYSVIGCTRNDSDVVIKSKYRELAKTFHPDTISSKALPAEFHKFAEDRFKQIQAAYDTIMVSRGST